MAEQVGETRHVSDANASSAENSEPVDLHQVLASEIRRRRMTKGLTQGQLAARTAYSREYTGRAERAGAGFPSPEVVNAIDAVLEAGGELWRSMRKQLRSGMRAGFSTRRAGTKVPHWSPAGRRRPT